MVEGRKQIAILGSTGSIGTQALEVIEANSDLFEVQVLTAQNNVDLLIEQALKFKPKAVVIGKESAFNEVKEALSNQKIEVLAGAKALEEVVQYPEIDIVLTALVGYAGLLPTNPSPTAKATHATNTPPTIADQTTQPHSNVAMPPPASTGKSPPTKKHWRKSKPRHASHRKPPRGNKTNRHTNPSAPFPKPKTAKIESIIAPRATPDQKRKIKNSADAMCESKTLIRTDPSNPPCLPSTPI